jgi:hypothetical protein
MKVVPIVEGDGEVAALPVLLRRLADWRSPGLYVDVRTPIRVKRDRFLNREVEFSRYMALAAEKCGDGGRVLVLLDADDDCPVALSQSVAMRAQAIVPHRPVSIVVANREYEAWFIASAMSLNGRRGFRLAGESLPDPELPRDAKGWIRSQMEGGRYGETTDQPALTAHMDLSQVHERSRSFRKLCSEWDRWVSS